MEIISRIVPPTEVRGKEAGPKTMVHRRVEVTVERETVSMWVRGPLPEGTEGAAWREVGPDEAAKELPSAAQSPVLEVLAPVPEGSDKNQK